ncbi:hypothetical protein JW916_15920 [Candidatus Sumerlaeota bacterium]|nr:hypothetical protein [Candidatus Sumerlaeota bacterium]
MFGRTLAGVYDNAMVYKDITQWLRNRTFLALFFGLLVLSEAVGLVCVSIPAEAGEMGPVAFGILSGVLALFVMTIALMGMTLTYREFHNRTFELYSLSGMSLERTIGGKSISMFAQFLFGFCCIVPFMFFSFLLGGLDFYLIFAVALSIAVAVPPLCLLALCTALHFRFKGFGILLWVGGIVVTILVASYISLFFIITIATRTSMPFGKPLDFFKALLDFDGDAWNGLSVFLLFYGQVCLLLFYLCCNAISPPQDSREHFVKFFAFTLTATALIAFASARLGPETLIVGGVSAFVMSCAIGLCYFYKSIEVPLMFAKRQRERRFFPGKILGVLFMPGAWGTLWTVLLIALAGGAFTGLVVSLKGSLLSDQRAISYALLPCQAPYFLIFPAGFLLNFERYRGKPKALRNAVLLWWVLVGVGLVVVVAALSDAQESNLLGPGQAAASSVCQILAYVVSPISAMAVGMPEYVELGSVLPWFRVVLGGMGVYLAIRSLTKTAARNRMERAKTRSAASS